MGGLTGLGHVPTSAAMKLHAVVAIVALALAGAAPLAPQDHTSDVAVAAFTVQRMTPQTENVTHLEHLLDHVTFDPQRFTLARSRF
jgi:hypothetical protein